MKHKTARISDLIYLLQEMEEEYGNLPIVLASDSEVNSIGTINTDKNVDANLTEEGGVAILFPHAEGLYIDDIIGYQEDTTEDEEDEEEDDLDDDDEDFLDNYDTDDE